MLIQCGQYVSEQGGDGTDLDFHGQDSDGGVVSIAKMNLILHNLQSSHIESGTEQARELILQKQHDLVAVCLQRYVQAEERALFGIFENLSAKYSASAEMMETARQATLAELQGFLSTLGYA